MQQHSPFHTDIHAARRAEAVCRLAIKHQKLIAQCMDLGLLQQANSLRNLDESFRALIPQSKMLGESRRYIWHSQDDDKVRPSHAANDGGIFSWDHAPATGHPGEAFNCRCWAEPVEGNVYADQLLITPINDNPDKWTNADLSKRYQSLSGEGVTLEEIGYLGDVIEHYSNTLGIYDNVNQQVIDRALQEREGSFTYDFRESYGFEGVLYSLGESTVKGIFVGNIRKEGAHSVVSGIVTYEFYDEFSDPLQLVELADMVPGVDREDGGTFFGDLVDAGGVPFSITGRWQTKYNATIKTD